MPTDVFERVEPVTVESPCVLVCVLDKRTGWCLGCGRTGDEIGEWTNADAARRISIMNELPGRMTQLMEKNGRSRRSL